MMLLFQIIKAPTVGNEPVPWSVIAAGLLGLLTIFAGMAKLWYDRHIAESDRDLVAATATRVEQQRLEKLVVAPLVEVASAIDKTTQILYMGRNNTDTAPIIAAFQEYGISNRLIVKVTTEGVMEYLTDHPDTTLAIVAYIVDAKDGQKFLTAVKGNKVTVSIPIIAIDGFTDAERVELFEAGVDGFLKHPFAVSALMLILTRLGFSSTFAKTK